MKKNIAFVISSLSGGGAENVVSRLANFLVTKGHTVYIFLLKNSINYQLDPKVNIIFLEGKNHKEKGFDFTKKMEKLENQSFRFHLKVSFLYGANRVAKLSGVKDIFFSIRNFESMRIKEKGFIQYLIQKRRLKNLYDGANIINVCDAVGEDILYTIGAKPKTIQTIYNPYDVDKIQRLSKEDIKNEIPQKYILHIGSFNNNQKRQDRAIEILKNIDTQYKLVFLGDGKLKDQILSVVKKEKLEDRVVFVGWQTNPYKFMKRANLVLITSDYEGFPNVLLESLITGTPVISLENKSGVKEILTGDFLKYVIKYEDKENLFTTIDSVLKEPYSIPKSLYEPFLDEIIVNKYLKLAQ